jgi:hypothetical protein
MKVIKLLLFLAVAGLAYQWYIHQPKTGTEALISEPHSDEVIAEYGATPGK